MNRLTCVVALLCIGWLGCRYSGDEGLVGYWRFNSNREQIEDLSGKGHTAKVAGRGAGGDDVGMVNGKGLLVDGW